MTEMVEPERLLRGLEFMPLPDGWTPIGAVVMVKCLDEEGRPAWAFRVSDDVNDEEILGALVLRTELKRLALIEAYTEGDD